MRKIIATAFALLYTCAASAGNLVDIVTKGSADRSVPLTIMDSTDGTPENAVVFNTSGIDLWYRREGAARVAVTEATLAALTTAHTDGGFLYISDGEYRLDLPDAAFATGANYVDYGGTVTGMIVIGGRVRLVDYSLEDAVRGTTGTALPNAAAGASGGVLISGTNSGTTTLGALTITGATTHTGATTYTGAVSMAAGVAITQSASNTAGLSVTGNGTGNGATFTSGSGATGNGISVTAASTNGNGLAVTGTGTGSGLIGTGGATGDGVEGIGGSTSGAGARMAGTAGNSPGATYVGQGSAAGSIATGGATGPGMSWVGGSTSGNALATAYTSPSGPVKGFGIIESGILQSATGTTAVLRSATSFADTLPVGATLVITGGTGAGQSRSISTWVNSTDTATVATWITTPDSTSTYEVWGTSAASGGGGDATAANQTTILTNLATIDDFIDTEVAAIKTKTDFLPSATAGAAGGVFIAGTNAATTITTGLTTTFTGSLSGSVGSVTGAVGSVTGNVGGNVTGSVGSVASGGITATSIATDAIGAAELASDAGTELAAAVTAAQGTLTGTCDSGSTTTCVDNALTQADATQLEDRLICFDDSWCALITTFTPGSDTATTTKTAPSTRASKAYTIFPATLE